MFLKLVETPRGVGQLWLGETPLGAVRYSLHIKREMHELPPAAQQEPMPGLWDIRGQVDPIEDQNFFELNGSRVTLEMEDLRRVDLILSTTGRIAEAAEWPEKPS